MAKKKKPRESLVMGSKKKKKAKTKKKTAKKRRSTRPQKYAPPGASLRGFKPLAFSSKPPDDIPPAREDERPEYSP